MIEIFVTSYNPTIKTITCIGSIMSTVHQPYCLTVISTNGSAAKNKNIAFDLARSGHFIIVDDDLIFSQSGWASMLMQSLENVPSATAVGGRVIFNSDGKSIGFDAPDDSLVDNIRVTGCMLAIKDVGIRYDENYIKSQGDDIDFMLQNRLNGYSVLCDTRVMANHPVAVAYDTDYHAHNAQYAYDKWGKEAYLKWGRDIDDFKIVKSY